MCVVEIATASLRCDWGNQGCYDFHRVDSDVPDGAARRSESWGLMTRSVIGALVRDEALESGQLRLACTTRTRRFVALVATVL